uniref:Late endosomal/lysosomal adaptor and MAPK and MTOR activator 5 n=1 Tax=Trichuris muris TaxID=70415 RepID=A0A5S6R0M5_TRIMR
MLRGLPIACGSTFPIRPTRRPYSSVKVLCRTERTDACDYTGKRASLFRRSARRMEKSLQNLVADVRARDDLSGCLCADEQGLCVAASGTLSEHAASNVADLYHSAAKLQPAKTKNPVICLEYSSRKVLITQVEQLIVATMY